MADAPQTTDQGDDAIVAALSGIIIDLVLDGRLGPGHGSRTAAEALVAELDRRGLRIVGARTGTIAQGNTLSVTLTTYQLILGELVRARAQLDAGVTLARDVVRLAEAGLIVTADSAAAGVLASAQAIITRG
ncbi:hypothetical protein FHP25_36055 [Vineibacter terrae]|uniref:Uncharacterized protein n=1 Tax=Vineibacter terrae TaxID=2586908 RepID=A0A5C8P9D3_9HYPH|nr:hypothetical protein [Vineibacter terrae]TXL70139.1 hypothetical protein FHP25_36055 [Vineibacter terrae]